MSRRTAPLGEEEGKRAQAERHAGREISERLLVIAFKSIVHASLYLVKLDKPMVVGTLKRR